MSDVQLLREYAKRGELTLEHGRGQTYAHEDPTIYCLSEHPESSVLAGQERREFVTCFGSVDEALEVIGKAGVEVTNLLGTGTSYREPALSHLPDDAEDWDPRYDV